MAIKVNNDTNAVSIVRYNDTPVSQVRYNGNIVYGAELTAPLIYAVQTTLTTYNTLTFIVKNQDYRILNLVVQASAAGHTTRTHTFYSVAVNSQTTVVMGSYLGEYLDSNTTYTLSAYVTDGTKQSSTSNLITGKTTYQETTAPSIEIILNKWYGLQWKVTNNETNLSDITTWLDLAGNIVAGPYTDLNQSFNAFNTYLTDNIQENLTYTIYATAKDHTGKLISDQTRNKILVKINTQETTSSPSLTITYPYNNIVTASFTVTNNDTWDATILVDLYKYVDGVNDQLVAQLSTSSPIAPGIPTSIGTSAVLSGGATYYTKRRAQASITEGGLNLFKKWSNIISTTSIPHTNCYVKWYYFNGSYTVLAETDTVVYNSTITVSDYGGVTPYRTGYTFYRWDQPDFYISPGTVTVTSDLTIDAMFTINSYTVTWYDNLTPGEIKSAAYRYDTVLNTYTNGTEPTYPPYVDISAGGVQYYHTGWSTPPPYTVKSDKVINAVYTPYGYAKFWMNIGDYSLFYSKQVKKDLLISSSYYPTTNPSYTGWVFTGWSPAAGTTYMPSDGSDKNIYAQWAKLYTVRWESDTGTFIQSGSYQDGYTLQSSDYPTAAFVNDKLLTAKRYFVSWNILPGSANATINGASITIKANTAEWQYARWWDGYSYILGNKIYIQSTQFAPGTVVTGYPQNPTRTSQTAIYSFAGWDPSQVYVTGVGYVSPTIGTTDMLITAKWNVSYTITWRNYDNTSNIGTTTVSSGSTIDSATAYYSGSSRTGYTWVGWSTSVEGSSISYPYTITSNITLYAIYNINVYSVSWRSYNNTSILSTTYHNYNTSVTSTMGPVSYGTRPDSSYTYDNGWDTTLPFTITVNKVIIRRYGYYTPGKPAIISLTRSTTRTYIGTNLYQRTISVAFNTTNYSQGYYVYRSGTQVASAVDNGASSQTISFNVSATSGASVSVTVTVKGYNPGATGSESTSSTITFTM